MIREYIYDGHDVEPPSPKKALAAITEFEALLANSTNENELHSFIAMNPFFLSWLYPHCHHVISKPRLGSEFVPDFMLAEMSSAGIEWNWIELEKANTKLVTNAGMLSETVRVAQQQIRDWFRWLEANRDYATRSIQQNGLGLEELEMKPWGMIVVGRRSDVTPRFNQLRSDSSNERIKVVTYDYILEWAKKRASEIWSVSNTIGFSLN